jgi:hypothetical protein
MKTWNEAHDKEGEERKERRKNSNYVFNKSAQLFLCWAA